MGDVRNARASQRGPALTTPRRNHIGQQTSTCRCNRGPQTVEVVVPRMCKLWGGSYAVQHMLCKLHGPSYV
eukprot:1026045-Pyramimonas_sp.AAC.1